MKKLSNEEIDQRLIGRNIKRLDDHINNKTKRRWQCLIENCKYIWQSMADNILNGKYGCPKCSNNERLTNENVDLRLIGRNIKRLDDIVNSKTKHNWQCEIEDCQYVWKTTPDTILNSKNGCPKCSNNIQLSNEIVDRKLIGRNIKRLDNIKNNSTKYNWQCFIEDCGFIWKATPKSILNIKSGCPKCSNCAKLTNKEVDRRLVGRNIKRLEDVENSNNKTKRKWKCLIEDCNYVWKTTSSNILDQKTGCPKCSIHKNEKLIGSTLEKLNINFEQQKNIRSLNNKESRNLRLDYYIIDFNIAIEYNGIGHYQPTRWNGISQEKAEIAFPKQQERDQYKQSFCKTNNIKLIEIDGRKYHGKKLENYINELIINASN